MKNKKEYLLFIVFCLVSIVVSANATLPKIFADNMVLQRNVLIPIWGWADVNEKVTVKFNGQTKIIKADKNGKWNFLSEKDLKAFLEDPIFKGDKEDSAVLELKGQVANRGVIKGIVKVIERRDEFPKFKAGDILVAPMTSVDYVPIMGIASAFITNEGGITSHASIVAREMNKPCIIGTKIATKVLKDGDLVEVDANAGVVKILKRK